MASDEETLDTRELIIGLRGGLPERCDFCGNETDSCDLHPEEAGQWACISCIKRWIANGDPY